MKRLLGAIMVMVVMCILSGCTSNENNITEKYNDILSKYNEVVTDYKDLFERYKNEIAENLAIPASTSAIANLISEDSLVTVFDERVVHITVPYSTDIKDTVEKYVTMIPSSIGSYEYESCIISVVDEMGKCVYGWTIYETGDTDTFISESFLTE